MDKKILLVPTDFSEVCLNAVNQAVNMSTIMNSKIVLLHIINSDTKAWLKDEGIDETAVEQRLKGIIEGIHSTNDVEMDFVVREGSIFTTIADVATDIKADFIFLGTHGKVGVQHLTGSFAMKVITSTDTPVIVVQKRIFEHLPKTIVVPVTSDAGPLEKTRIAVKLAQELDATVHLLQMSSDDKLAAAVHDMMGEFSRNFIKTKHVIAPEGTEFTKQVIDYSVENNADMILIMTNPDKSWTSYFFGSYDEDLIFNTAQIPVLCINPRRKNVEKIFSY